MKLLTVNALHDLTDLHGDTIRKHTAQLPRDGRGRMNSALALRLLPLANGSRNGEAPITHSEALRRLAIAKTRQIEIDVEIKQGSRIPLEDVARSDMEIFKMFAATLKANHNKVLTLEIINEMFEGIRNWAQEWRARAEAAPPCHPTLWKNGTETIDAEPNRG